MRPFVVYWNNIPSPYIVDRFNAMADRKDIEFEAWFNDRLVPIRSWDVDETAWLCRYRYLPATRIGCWKCHWPIHILVRRPDVLVSLYAEPSFLVGWGIAKIRDVRTAFWCQVTWDTWVKRKAWKDAIKRFVFSRVDATLGSGEESRRFAMRYGTPPEKALCLLHSIDLVHFQKGVQALRDIRNCEREAKGLKGIVFLYVGRLWWGKGLNYLIDAFASVQNRSEAPVSLLLLGDGPEEESIRTRCTELDAKNVVFSGFVQKQELPKYYGISDVFVFPTLGDPYGTVVDEAMACSLPIISTRATGEIGDRVTDDVNGYIVPEADSVALADAMYRFAENPALCKIMGMISADRIADRSLERWAEDLERISRSLLDGAGIGAFFVTEQLAFQQSFRNRRAVDRDKTSTRPWAQAVQ